MAQHLYFYQDLTQIAEDRINELIRHAEEMEAREHSFPKAGSYFRDCAVCVYLAWRDVTVGWHVDEDLKRLAPCGKLVVASNLKLKYRGRHESDVF
jgi:hypothetical protein